MVCAVNIELSWLFQQPFHDILDTNTVVVAHGQVVSSQNDLLIVVADQRQRAHFAIKGFLRCHIRSDLDVGQLALLFGNEIHFRIPQLAD